MSKIGVLLTNTGTPDAPTKSAVRRYLREFLSDKRVVQLPRFIWLPILYGLVLTLRPKKSVALYKKIWTSDGSPMRVHMQNMASRLQQTLGATPVEIGMNYGNPSILQGLKNLHAQKVSQVIALPLFPQYSHTTTASSFDHIEKALKKISSAVTITPVEHYHTHPAYIHSLVNSVKNSWKQTGRQSHLLISFHGIPKRFASAGDPYPSHCEQTSKLLAEDLQLKHDEWTLCFQSQFGYDKWLTPSTQNLLTELPKRGIEHVDIICPGFSVDCLETLEEIMIQGKEIFIEAGGKTLNYIPALNDSDDQIAVLTDVLLAVT